MLMSISGFLVGVVSCQFGAALPAPSCQFAAAVLAAGCGLAGALLYRSSRERWPGLALVLTMLAGLAAGYAYAGWRAELRLAQSLPGDWEGRDVAVTGIVATLPQNFGRGVRFVFEVEAPAGGAVPRRISLVWYRGADDDEAGLLGEVHAGERWHLLVRLKRPHGNVNRHGFDYEAWLLEQDLRATGYVRADASNRRLDAFVLSPGTLIERLREVVRSRFQAALPDGRYAGVLIALAIGDQRAIPQEQWSLFARTGIAHLVSISGLHVTMVAALCAAVIGAIWRRVPALALRVPAQQAAVATGALAAGGYALLAGWGVPAQRTFAMLAWVALALLLRREAAPFRVLGLALLGVLLLDPWAVLAPGFWLSFGAVALLFLAGSGRLAAGGRIREALRAQWAVTVGMVPALLVLFQQCSLVSPLANGLAIPVVSFVVTPLALLFSVFPLQILADVAHAVLGGVMLPVEWLGGLPYAQWQQAAPPFVLALMATLGCLWALLPAGTPARWLGASMLLPLLAWHPARPAPGALKMTVLDVGQGLAVHLQTAAHDLLYDAGPAFSADANSGERIVLPYLRAQGVRRLDSVVVTHQDNDHAGGAEAVLGGIPVAEVRSSLPTAHPARLIAADRHLPCRAGDAWEWDGVRFRVLHPGAEADADRPRKTNNLSCVIRVDAAGHSVLLTSDIEASDEEALLARDPGALASDLVLAPHHGSRTSSTPAFVAATHPAWVLFPVGYRNRFHHPNPEVWSRWSGAGARMARTDAEGALEVRVDAEGVQVEGARAVAPRYWYGR